MVLAQHMSQLISANDCSVLRFLLFFFVSFHFFLPSILYYLDAYDRMDIVVDF